MILNSKLEIPHSNQNWNQICLFQRKEKSHPKFTHCESTGLISPYNEIIQKEVKSCTFVL